MNYFIKREEKEYGPYSLADLQKYVASGNMLLTDLCRSEGLSGLGSRFASDRKYSGAGRTCSRAAQQPVAGTVLWWPTWLWRTSGKCLPQPVVSQYPPPPNAALGCGFALTIVTCWLFGWVWLLFEPLGQRK